MIIIRYQNSPLMIVMLFIPETIVSDNALFLVDDLSTIFIKKFDW
jgi:hypothetical protein